MNEPLRLRTSNTNRPVLETLAADFELEFSCKLELIVDSTKNALERIERGEYADLAILHEASIDKLAADGILDASTNRPFAQSLIGVAVRAGSSPPAIGTVAEFRQTLLDAGSVAHTQYGPSGSYFPQLLERLGIADEVLPKAVPKPGGYIGYAVAEGEAEMAFQQICELLVVPGIDIVGPIPAELQRIVMTRVALFAQARQPVLARKLIGWCSQPCRAHVFRNAGLEQLS